MKMIEIVALDNGAHRNQTFSGVLPDGWAVIPDSLETANFPFGEVTVKAVNGVMTVTKWVPGTVPEPEPEPEHEPTAGELLEERVSHLETALIATDEAAMEMYETMLEQEGINDAQDDALMALYEMVTGG